MKTHLVESRLSVALAAMVFLTLTVLSIEMPVLSVSASEQSALLDLNKATAEDLRALRILNDDTVERIIAHQKDKPFHDVKDIQLDVRDPELFARLEAKVFVLGLHADDVQLKREELIVINLASKDELMALLDIKDPTIAQTIIDRRKRKPFTALCELEKLIPPELYRQAESKGVQVGPPELARGERFTTKAICLVVFVLSAILGSILTFYERPHFPSRDTARYWTDDWKWKLGRSVIWFGIGVACLWFIQKTSVGPLFCEEQFDANLPKFFLTNQATLLTLIVALGAYTSSVEQILRGKVNGLLMDEVSVLRHDVNLRYMYRTDIILVLAAAVLIWRMASWAFGYSDDFIDRLNIGLLAWAILYFCWNHIRQLVRPIKRLFFPNSQ